MIIKRIVKRLATHFPSRILWLHKLTLRGLSLECADPNLLLKGYLELDHQFRPGIIAKHGFSLFGGVHPKNVFNFRYEFFAENVNSNDVVLDVACGSGIILKRIASLIAKGYGLDRDVKSLDLTEVAGLPANIQLISGDIFSTNYISLQNETGYSVVFLSHILEHLENVPAFLRMVLAEKLLICVPSQENWLSALKKSLGLDIRTDGTHFREYTREMLRDELNQAIKLATR
jgi:SAM-dependent methyltransferase